MVGPFRGGRTTAVAGMPDDPYTFLAGYTGGGVFRSDDAGHHWSPITDGFLSAGAVGAVAVAVMHVLPLGRKHGAEDAH